MLFAHHGPPPDAAILNTCKSYVTSLGPLIPTQEAVISGDAGPDTKPTLRPFVWTSAVCRKTRNTPQRVWAHGQASFDAIFTCSTAALTLQKLARHELGEKSRLDKLEGKQGSWRHRSSDSAVAKSLSVSKGGQFTPQSIMSAAGFLKQAAGWWHWAAHTLPKRIQTARKSGRYESEYSHQLKESIVIHCTIQSFLYRSGRDPLPPDAHGEVLLALRDAFCAAAQG